MKQMINNVKDIMIKEYKILYSIVKYQMLFTQHNNFTSTMLVFM